MKYIFWLIAILLISCDRDPVMPKVGQWRAVLDLGNGKELPFLMQYNADNSIVIFNAEEAIEIKDVKFREDSIFIQHPVFEGVFKGVYSRDSIYGDFVKPSLNREIPFLMKQGRAQRFTVTKAPSVVVTGNWEAVFSPGSETDSYPAQGIFNQKGHKVTGTFRTTTGDYRYLEGAVENDSMKLSAFDGAHAFLFEAQVKDSIMSGMFYSGNHFKEPFTAVLNEQFELQSADSLTFLKEGYERFEFSFPNTEGKLVSLEDSQFQDKVVIVQIMGTWCPNCLDETKYLTEYYKKNKADDLEFVALAFESAKTEEKAMVAINKLKAAIDVPYPVLLAQYGTNSKLKANEKLPMLSQVLSYPTTIFIDKSGKVRKIHTGFNGPATGEAYNAFTSEFETFVQALLKEEATEPPTME
jgi:thiol-disulfide isomerase/thioredoxin